MLSEEFAQLTCEEVPNMDTSRHCVRRGTMVPHKEAEFSRQSIMKAMEKFVTTVQEMDETILVPSRLMDLQVGDSSDTVAPKKRNELTSTDLYKLYTMVNTVRKDLLWGGDSSAIEEQTIKKECASPVAVQVNGSSAVVNSSSTSVKGHVRRPSNVSTNSSISDTDSEAGLENDSGVEGEGPEQQQQQVKTKTERMEENFRRHLYGLHRSLDQMTEAASYLTKRYQHDVGPV